MERADGVQRPRGQARRLGPRPGDGRREYRCSTGMLIHHHHYFYYFLSHLIVLDYARFLSRNRRMYLVDYIVAQGRI